MIIMTSELEKLSDMINCINDAIYCYEEKLSKLFEL